MCVVAEHPGDVDQGLQGERRGGERRGHAAEKSHQEERGKTRDELFLKRSGIFSSRLVKKIIAHQLSFPRSRLGSPQ